MATRASLCGQLRASPATFIYLAILLITTLVMVTLRNHVALFLQEQSTNLKELSTSPMRVMVLMRFGLHYDFLVWAIL